MIVKKLAISPMSARIPEQRSPHALAEDRLEAVEEWRRLMFASSAAPPPTPVLRNRMPMANSISVVSPHIVARPMSRFGSWDSSAAKGSSSIAR